MLLSESFGLFLALSFSTDVKCLSPREAWHPPIKEAEVLPALGAPAAPCGHQRVGFRGGFRGSRAPGLSDVGITERLLPPAETFLHAG